MSSIAGSVGKGGLNKKPDVRAVQCLLNLSANMVQSGRTTKLVMNGSVDKTTQDAIDLYQVKVMKLVRPDGRVDARGGTIRRLEQALGPMPSGPFNTPRWLAIAHGEEGVKEEGTGTELERRVQNSPRILEYLATAAHLSTIDDKITARDAQGKPLKDAKGTPTKQATGYNSTGNHSTTRPPVFTWVSSSAALLAMDTSPYSVEIRTTQCAASGSWESSLGIFRFRWPA